ILCFFFFFQAEDGIRDSSVTGVQTCALPISRVLQHDRHWKAQEPADLGLLLPECRPRVRRRWFHERSLQAWWGHVAVGAQWGWRSEERRVGKEWTGGGGRGQGHETGSHGGDA